MTTTLVFNGNSYVFPTDFVGDDGFAFYDIWEDFFSDLGTDLQFVQGPGAISLSSVAIGTGAKSFTLAAAANLKAGTYRIESVATLGSVSPNLMMVTLATDLVAGTALSVTSSLVVGSGSHADWIIMPVFGTTGSGGGALALVM